MREDPYAESGGGIGMENKKKPLFVIVLGIILLTCVFFVSFGMDTGQSNNGADDSPAGKKKVVFLSKSMNSEFWQSAYAGAGAASTEYNLDLLCEGPADEEDYEMQNIMIEQAIKSEVDAIVFSAVDFEANADAVTKAAEKGIEIVLVDSEVNSPKVKCYIGTDNYEAGCTAGEEVLKNPEEKLRIGLINFDVNTENGQTREQGVRDTIAKDGRAEIIASINVKSSVRDAKEGTIKMLRENPRINVLVTFNEWTSLGVGYAVEEMKLGEETQVIAFDNNAISVGMLETGVVDALVVQNPYAMGYLGIEKAYALLNNQALKEKKVETASILVTRENMYDDSCQRALFSFDKQE